MTKAINKGCTVQHKHPLPTAVVVVLNANYRVRKLLLNSLFEVVIFREKRVAVELGGVALVAPPAGLATAEGLSLILYHTK